MRPTYSADAEVYREKVQAFLAEKLPVSAEMAVIATPGPKHIDALPLLSSFQGKVLVEKPLGYTWDEYQRWLDYSASSKNQVSVCHNYRFKSNVLEMWGFLRKYNSGALRHVSVLFQSLPVAQESAAPIPFTK